MVASAPLVSVVVATYNSSHLVRHAIASVRASTLEDCLTSLEALTYHDFEVILVNDGSKDRTSAIGHHHPRVRVIDTPNQGLSAARNVGSCAARSFLPML